MASDSDLPNMLGLAPPQGCQPEWLLREQRIKELTAAIERWSRWTCGHTQLKLKWETLRQWSQELARLTLDHYAHMVHGDGLH